MDVGLLDDDLSEVAALARLLAHGATLVHAPITTPWGDRNVRPQHPDGLQVTPFEVTAAPDAVLYMDEAANPTP